jgi:GAF domain-containing protein/HAMP domain-containing protein
MMTTKPKADKSPLRLNLTIVLMIAFVSLSLVVLIASQSAQLFISVQAQQAAVSIRQLLIAENASKTVSNFIDQKFNALETAVKFSNPIVAITETQQTFMGSLLGSHPAFRQFALFGTAGQQLAQTSRISRTLSAQFIAQQAEAIAQTSTSARYISPVYIDDATSEPLITIAIPVTNVLGDHQGTLTAEVGLKFMWDLVQQLEVGKTGYAYVVDNQGNLLAFEDTTRVLAHENVQKILEVQEFVENPSKPADLTVDVNSYTGISGTSVVGTYVPLGTPQWAVVVELPTEEAYQESYKQGIFALLISGGVILIAGLLGFWGARQLATPLIGLSKTAHEIARGNLVLQAKVDGPTEIAEVATSFNVMTARLREFIGSLEERVAERTETLEVQAAELTQRSTELEKANQQSLRKAGQLQLVAETTKRIATVQNVDTLLREVADDIHELFGFYHVGIFINDLASGTAVLKASNSIGGQRMLARQHGLKIGSVGIVGYVAGTGKPRIALNTGEDAAFFNNPDLPNTHSEMAIPLNLGNQTIGVLDVQSTEEDAFDDDDLKILTILADQVNIALQNARLFEDAQRAAAEMQGVLRQYARDQWSAVTKKQNKVAYRYKGGFQTLSKKMLYKDTEATEEQVVPIPIVVRGQTIGTLSVRASKNRIFSEDELDIVRATTERVSIAAENARLFEQTTERAERERKVAEITSKIRSTNNPDEMIQIALHELKQALNIKDARVLPYNKPTQDQDKG